MKIKNIIVVAVLFYSSQLFAQSQNNGFTIRELGPEDMITCPIGEHSSNLYLPPDYDRSRMTTRKAGLFKDSLLNVTPEFIPAIDFVLDFLENFFTSEVPINVWVEIDELGGSALAGARPSAVVENFNYAPYQNIEYPIALAEKLLGRDINNPNRPDIIITINSEFDSWYLKPNDPTGIRPNQIDLASVLTHEMIHGLGFFESGAINDAGEGLLEGFLDRDHVVAFDRNIINGDGQYLYQEFASPSVEMAQQFTSENIFYKSETYINKGGMPELYAPAQFAQGSSLSHLGEIYRGGRDGLMTFAFQGGEVIYFPGDFTLDILYDMGWDATRIIHEPTLFSEDINTSFEVNAEILADSEFDSGTFMLHYSRDSFDIEDNILNMVLNQATGMYQATLPAPGMELEYQYYFELTDGRGIKRTRPGGGPENFFTYNYGIDNEPPVMDTPLDIALIATDDAFPLQVNAFDYFSGVDSVSAIVKINGKLDTLGLIQAQVNNGNTYFENYSFERTFNPTDTIEYRFLATDKSSNANSSIFPVDSFLKAVYFIDTIPPILEHDPVTSVTNFDKSFRIKVSAFDNFVGISNAYGVIKINDNVPDTIELSFAPTIFGDFYEGTYSFNREFNIDDNILYSIFAIDNAYVPNQSNLPEGTDFYSIPIIEIPSPVDAYFNDFNAVTEDFNGSGFRIGAVGGFPDAVIQSDIHPYPEGGPGQVIDFTYELIKPIIVAGKESTIEFDEVALVEFGDAGSRWPNESFFDYVIVEAKKLKGTEYFPLIDGYDCTAYPAWRSRYESGLNAEGISSATPSSDLLRHRLIDIRDNGDFIAGDTILVRFRLFSDNAAAGWGWLIDNLKIQNSSTSAEEILLAGNVNVFPNPVSGGVLNLSLEIEENLEEIYTSIFNISGARIGTQKHRQILDKEPIEIDVSGLNSGTHFLQIMLDKNRIITKKFIIK